MTRRHITFTCAGDRLIGTLDSAPGRTALLIVSGGNEVRAGAWNGQALFAARVAARGYPVFRYDRRGVGDSEGHNSGFRGSAPDIAAACAALRADCPQVDRVVGFGNCDAASALMLARGGGLDDLILSNPWTFDEESVSSPPEVVRAHYLKRLKDFSAFRRLLTGKVSMPELARSLLLSIRRVPVPAGGLTAELQQGLAAFPGLVRILVAERDRTGLAFLARWSRTDERIRICSQASHSYVEPEAQQWLLNEVLQVLDHLPR
ncbi:hydrolase 1, exosortase A system-associated [Novosphingobium panipatense]|uniref:Exosortase A system-associated hydrolase 1 n=1 Tax=Novosphingobium panipatense TaxID=428991 RepID=A0ABY1Q1G6_9SPHN|nr:hydrolase 1, exosortase A system-associated [Novosphingobium panipatense]SMP56150.1 exosortase A system-associated hydrolase 1 [Novosphingobium panipatense]